MSSYLIVNEVTPHLIYPHKINVRYMKMEYCKYSKSYMYKTDRMLGICGYIKSMG